MGVPAHLDRPRSHCAAVLLSEAPGSLPAQLAGGKKGVSAHEEPESAEPRVGRRAVRAVSWAALSPARLLH